MESRVRATARPATLGSFSVAQARRSLPTRSKTGMSEPVVPSQRDLGLGFIFNTRLWDEAGVSVVTTQSGHQRWRLPASLRMSHRPNFAGPFRGGPDRARSAGSPASFVTELWSSMSDMSVSL